MAADSALTSSPSLHLHHPARDQPADQATAPADQATAPADQATAPADQATAPADKATGVAGASAAAVASAALAVAAAGCLAPIHPRPAHVAAPRSFTWDVHIPLVEVAHGTARGQVAPQDPGDAPEPIAVSGVPGGLYDVSGSGGAGPPPLWFELSARVGVFPRCEVGAFVGAFRQGGELRCAVVTAGPGGGPGGREGLAVAGSAGAAYLPFFGMGGPWLRAGLDISKTFRDVTIMTNAYYATGPSARDYGAQVPVELWDPPLDETVSHDPGPTLQIVRDERRLAVAIGVGIHPAGARHAFVVGLVPFVVLGADPIRRAECDRCPRVSVTDLDDDWGVVLTLGGTRMP